MAKDTVNDNDIGGLGILQQKLNANGRAAILLVESLLHGLIGRSVISVAEAVEIVEVAAGAIVEIAYEYPEGTEALTESLSILTAISSSLKRDV